MTTPGDDIHQPNAPALQQRRAGVLLHPMSLPGGFGNGDLGPSAYHFADFLHSSGCTVWQTLPLGPTNDSGSPYQCLSVHAGNVLMVSLELLQEAGWLEPDQGPEDTETAADYRRRRLSEARRGFSEHASDGEKAEYRDFLATHAAWLDDYALFIALKQEHGQAAWWDWPAAIRDRRSTAMAQARGRLLENIEQERFAQFLFARQWAALKTYANDKGVLMFGDMPIFVAEDSAEVWAQREYFELGEDGRPSVVAGVPPDYFSATGQRWGNPHYRWDSMQADGFAWWKERVARQLEMFDIIRVDHFRGFEAYWEIPADEETAINGSWVKAPGAALFTALQEHFGPLPLVAEDLGIITEEVDELRHRFRLPGMKVLQFAFDGGPENPYLPHNHAADFVAYTGTHDNDTTMGWYDARTTEQNEAMHDYLGFPLEPMPWPMIRAALRSVAKLAVVPMQDVMGLGSEHRMNTPGTTADNWAWRFDWDMLNSEDADKLRRLVEQYGRAV